MNDINKTSKKPAIDKDGNEISKEGKWLAGILFILFTLTPIILIIGLWPDKMPGETTGQWYRLRLFGIELLGNNSNSGNRIHINTILFILVALAGFLGSMIHIATSFTNYIGSLKFKRSWVLWYVVKPFSAAGIALIFYLVLQAGLLNFGDGGRVNPYGIVILSALAGLFADKAMLKLEEIFLIIFKPKDDRPDKMKEEVRITGITPMTIKKGKENSYVVAGENLDKVKLKLFINEDPVTSPEITISAIKFKYSLPETEKDKTEFMFVIKNEQEEVKYQQALTIVEDDGGPANEEPVG